MSPCGHGQSNSRQFKKQGNLDTTLNEVTYKKCYFGSGISKMVGPKKQDFCPKAFEGNQCMCLVNTQ